MRNKAVERLPCFSTPISAILMFAIVVYVLVGCDSVVIEDTPDQDPAQCLADAQDKLDDCMENSDQYDTGARFCWDAHQNDTQYCSPE